MKLPTILSALTSLLIAACGPAGEAPFIEDIPPQEAAVNQEFVLNIVAADPDGDAIDYSFESSISGLRNRAQLTSSRTGGGIFRWTPDANDIGLHAIDFIVSDGSNTERLTVQVDVKSAIGASATPAFQEPVGQGTTLPLTPDSRCITLPIVIRDSDSIDVTIEEVEPKIPGATLDQTSGLTGRWNWCPSDEQIAETDRYQLRLRASDGEHESETLVYTIALRGSVATEEPGEPGEGSCEDDALEPNNTLADATEAIAIDGDPFSATNLSACDEFDFYSMVLFDGDTVSVELTFDTDSDDYNTGFFDSGFNYSEFSISTPTGAELEYTFSDANCDFFETDGCIRYVDVFSDNVDGGKYDIAIDVSFTQ